MCMQEERRRPACLCERLRVCQKLIKRQQKQGDGDQSLIECANPASAASIMLQEAAAELFAAAHIPPPPAASGKEEDGPRSPGDK